MLGAGKEIGVDWTFVCARGVEGLLAGDILPLLLVPLTVGAMDGSK